MINMIDRLLHKLSGRTRSVTVSFALLAFSTTIGAAQQAPQPTFSSAAEATQSLFQAVQSNNEETIADILGASTDLTSSRDPGQDKVDRELFVQKYQEMHRLCREIDGSVTLYIGAENWPFPLPLVNKNGAWRFDSDAGTKEIMFRRIGENELTAIAICHDFIAAAKRARVSSNNATPEDGTASTLVATTASASSGSDPVLFHGYYFRRLPASPNGSRGGMTKKVADGFVMIAYPAEYRSSGVMTFVVMDNDVVYEKDFGAKTSALATAIAAFQKDATWHKADE